MSNLFSTVDAAAGTASDPAPLPDVAIARDGRTFSDLAGQVERSDLTRVDLATLFALWPATVTETPYDPETEAPIDLVMTLDRKAKTVAAMRGKRALTADELAEREAIRNPVPASISDRQFFQALALRGLITEAEALAAVKTGAIPAQLQAAVDTIKDEAQHFAAVMLISGATVFERAHPMAAMLGQAIGKDSADLDELWRFGATL